MTDLRRRVLRFVADPASGDFDGLALEVFRHGYERVLPYRRLCDARGVDPRRVRSWRETPPVPTLAFKSLELTAAPAMETFRSSGTRGGEPSVHHHPFPDLYRAVIDATFPGAVIPHLSRPPMLLLVPDREQAPDSSLAFMLDHVRERFGAPESVVGFSRRGVERPKARGWLAARQRSGQAVVVLATAFALADLLDFLDRLGLRFRLPAGSVVFETGGFKGRRREVAREELVARAGDFLGVPPEAIVREYGMTELTSHFYTRVLAGGDPDLFVPPPWTRVRIVDPASLEEVAAGETGLVAVFDLANLGSAAHLLTEDLGRAEGDGFRLVGRAAGAELRGCSLAVEELSTR